MLQMVTDPAVLAREAANFERIAEELKVVIARVQSTATGLYQHWKGTAADAAQTAIRHFNEAGTAHVGQLNDISTNISSAGIRYTAADEEATRRLSEQMHMGGDDGHDGHQAEQVDHHWKQDPHFGKDHDVPGPHPGDPQYATGEHPTLAGDPHDQPPMRVDPGSSAKVELSDNPPGYNGPAGPGRDAAWQAYLSQQNGTARPGSVPAKMVLPNPDAVNDPGLKTVGAAAKQQGVSYAWGAGHPGDPTADKPPIPPGVTKGTLYGDIDGKAHEFGDNNRTGFDCSGLSRFATSEGHNGLDISQGTWGDTVSQFGKLTDNGVNNLVSDADLKPGDLIYFGSKGDSHHVAIYAGNGLMVQAHGSGIPVEVSPLTKEQHSNVHIPN